MLKFKFTGVTPLIMHSDRLSNPFLDETKAHKELTSKRKKTEDDLEDIKYSEWRGGLYFDEGIGPYIPAENIRKCIIEGARLNKLGKAIERGVIIPAQRIPLKYAGPRDIKGLYQAKKFVDVRAVVVQRARLFRCRPIFPDWEIEFDIDFSEEMINSSDLVMAAKNAGRFIGICDQRPMFGRFDVEVV